MRARIQSYELAFRMQMSVPEVVRLEEETAETRALYGLDDPACREAARHSLAARGGSSSAAPGSSRSTTTAGTPTRSSSKNHGTRSAAVDKPIAGLLTDLKRRGPPRRNARGRGPRSSAAPPERRSPTAATTTRTVSASGWRAAGSRGVVHGATDEIGFHAVENRHYVTDIHATLLHQLGLDPRRLEIRGRSAGTRLRPAHPRDPGLTAPVNGLHPAASGRRDGRIVPAPRARSRQRRIRRSTERSVPGPTGVQRRRASRRESPKSPHREGKSRYEIEVGVTGQCQDSSWRALHVSHAGLRHRLATQRTVNSHLEAFRFDG